jgi:hypothetical protein
VFGDNKVAIVTGIGPGMGRSIAMGFARHGVDVVLAARRQDRLEAVAEEVRMLGREPSVVPADITDLTACRQLVDAAAWRFGDVDMVVQNAHHEGDWATIADGDVASWQAIFDVNLYGALHLIQAAIPVMRARGGGAVVLGQQRCGAVLACSFGCLHRLQGGFGRGGPDTRGRGRPVGHPGQRRFPRRRHGRQHSPGRRASIGDRGRHCGRVVRAPECDTAVAAHADPRRVRRGCPLPVLRSGGRRYGSASECQRRTVDDLTRTRKSWPHKSSRPRYLKVCFANRAMGGACDRACLGSDQP